MSEKPLPGDRVRATQTIEGVLKNGAPGVQYVEHEDGTILYTKIGGEDRATVELIETADDPSRDPVGTVRRGGNANNAWAKTTTDCWSLVGEVNTSVRDSGLLGTAHPIIGAVPGTPAWDLWITGELKGAPRAPGQPVPLSEIFGERPLWTGDGSEEPPSGVVRLRDNDGEGGSRRGDRVGLPDCAVLRPVHGGAR